MKRKVSLIFVAVLTLLVMIIATFTLTVNADDSAITEYTITYHLDGGTNAIKNPDVYTSEDAITLQAATKDGYTFDGWYLDASKTNKITEISGMEGNINLYAKFSPKSYTATFNDEIKLTVSVPGFEDKIYYVPYGTSIDPYSYSFMSMYLPSNKNSPTTSYLNDPKFSGWYILNSDGTKTKISASLTVNTDTTIVCDFKKSIDTVLEYYEEMRYGTYTGERGVGLDGYLFVPTLSNGKVTITFDLPPFSGTGGYNYIETYILNWTTSKVYHSVGRRTQLYETITINANPGDVIQIKVTGSSTNGRVTITAPGRMTAPLVSKKSSQATVYYDNMVDVPQPSSREGYVFVGWEDKNGNIFDGSKWTYLKSMTFVPKYQPRKYSIRYELDGGVNNISNPSNYTIEDTITLQAPSKKGYTFEGWFSDKALTTPVTKISNSTGDLTLYAKYSVNTYDLYLDGAGGSFSPKVVFVSDGKITRTEYLGENDSIKAYRPDQKEGYIFGGWYTDETLKSAFKFTGTISDDITLYAKWIECDSDIIYPETIENFNVTINGKTEKYYAFVPLNDGTVKVTSDSDNLDLYGILYNSTKGILTQADDISDSDLDFSFSYKVKANQLYYICVKGNTASTKGDAVININFTGGTVISGTTYSNREIEVTYGSNFSLPDLPVKEGYVFLGWYDETDTQVTNGKWEFISNKILTAKWREKTPHTITFKDENGEVLAVQDYLYGDIITPPEFPVKKADQTYTYDAKWDHDYSGICVGDVTYTVVYTPVYIDYSIVFKDADGTVLSSKTYHYGDAVTAPQTPTKAADSTYTYTFAGWDKSVISCAGNATYTATYKATYIDYTVEFKDYNGKVLSRKNYHYGDAIAVPSDPARSADNTYTYVFAGWDTSVTSVCGGSATYTATYTPVYINYTVVFKDYNGKIIISNTYHYGDKVTAPKDPTRETDVWGSYTFKAWNREIVDCVGDATYTATYDVTYTNYTVTFKNWNGDVISTKSYHYGDTVITPADPTREADKTYTYSFAGWDRKVVACDGDKVYTATYTPVYIDYTVVFKDWDGEVISSATYHYGDKIVIPGTPSRGADNKFTYAFKDWSKTVSETCVGDAEYTASYEATYIEYNIRFLDWDGSLIQTVKYHYGDTITAIADPERESDETYTYTFLSWNKALGTCTGNASFTAQYESTFINYTVVFKDYDGSVISRKTYHFGDRITIPADPVRASDDTYSYTFKNWGNISTSCNGNKEYTAVYKAEYIDYTVTFKDHDGSVIGTQTYHFGDDVTAPKNPTRTADNTFTYAFAGWDKSVVACDGDAIYTATYTPTFIDYTVEFKDHDGTVISTKTYHYGDAVTVPTAPTRESDVYGSYTFKDWDGTVVNCAGDAIYTATYDITYTDYTVIFKDDDGTVLDTKTYHYGDEVVAPTAPTKAADNTYTYSFKAWDREVVACAGNATYTATYESTYIDYTVVFKDENGMALSTNTYHYGEEILIPQAPIKPADKMYTYSFAGWDNNVVNCDGDATYTATYISECIYYTVIFKDADGGEIYQQTAQIYGSAIVAPVSPSKQGGVFEGWDGYAEGQTVCEDIIFVAVWHMHAATDAVIENNVDPDCTNDGHYDSVIYCAVCEAELSREVKTIEKLGHDHITEWTVDVEPTCTTVGSKSHHCSRCDDKADITEIPANGHKYGEWYETKAPTCTATGTNEHKCSVCDHTETKTTNELGHTEGTAVVENQIESTCTTNGSYDSVVYCLVCGNELSRESKTIDLLNHNYSDEWTVDVEPNCTTTGSKSHHCLICDDIADVTTIPAGGHTYDDNSDVSCNNCGEIRDIETDEPTEYETIETTESETTETIESETTETTESETTESTEPATKETTEVETNGQMDNKPGCGGSISGYSIVFVALFGLGALQLTKKKKQD